MNFSFLTPLAPPVCVCVCVCVCAAGMGRNRLLCTSNNTCRAPAVAERRLVAQCFCRCCGLIRQPHTQTAAFLLCLSAIYTYALPPPLPPGLRPVIFRAQPGPFCLRVGLTILKLTSTVLMGARDAHETLLMLTHKPWKIASGKDSDFVKAAMSLSLTWKVLLFTCPDSRARA